MKTFYIFWKELKGFFKNPITYAISAVFLFITGYLFSLNLVLVQRVDFMPQLISAMVFVLLFVTPALTMRLLAEERQQQTVALLFTSPVANWEIVLGKFLACLGYVVTLLAVTGLYPWLLTRYGEPDMAVIASAYLGAVLILSCFVAIGLFTSSLSDSQMMAAVLSFGISLFFWIIHFVSQFLKESATEGLAHLVEGLSLHVPLIEFLTGAIHLKYVIFYLSFAGFFLFLTNRKLSSNAWR